MSAMLYRSVRRARAVCAMQSAIGRPLPASDSSAGAEWTEEQVARAFGPDAVRGWKAMRAGARAFWASVEKAPADD